MTADDKYCPMVGLRPQANETLFIDIRFLFRGNFEGELPHDVPSGE